MCENSSVLKRTSERGQVNYRTAGGSDRVVSNIFNQELKEGNLPLSSGYPPVESGVSDPVAAAPGSVTTRIQVMARQERASSQRLASRLAYGR